MNTPKFKLYMLTLLVILVSLIAAHLDGRRILSDAEQPSRYESMAKLQRAIGYIDNLYVDEINWNKTVEGAIQGALETLDPHSLYITYDEVQTNQENFEGHYQGIGIQFDIIDEYITVISVIPGSPSEEVGLQAGDRIIKIEGETARNISTSEVPRRLKGPRGSKVTVTIMRTGLDTPFDVTIVRDEIPIFTVNTYFKADSATGYIWLNRFAGTTAEELEDAMRDLEQQGISQLLLDLRGNGGGYLRQAVEVVGKFIGGHRKVVYTKGRLSRFNDTFYTDDFGTGKVRNYPLIVLIDHSSASASEIVAGAIQDYDRGLIAGTNSFGKGLVQNEFELSDASRLRLTVSRYYTPSGRLIQRPYKDRDTEEYYHWEDADSISQQEAAEDTTSETRPVYFTKAGRKVYGGGGIKPDVKIPWESYSRSGELTRQLYQKRIFFETAAQYVQANPQWKEDFEGFYQHQVEDRWLNRLRDNARAQDIVFEDSTFYKDRDYLTNRLKAEIARNMWGMNRFYQVLLQYDNQFQKALQLFPQALEIIKLYELIALEK